MKLFIEMKNAMAYVIEAEENAAAWKQEAADRMKKVNNLIRAEEIASETKLDKKQIIAKLRAQLMPEAPAEPAQAPAENVENVGPQEIPDTPA